jgi:hypothetical protein
MTSINRTNSDDELLNYDEHFDLAGYEIEQQFKEEDAGRENLTLCKRDQILIDEQAKLESKLLVEETCSECLKDVSQFDAYQNWGKFQEGIYWPKRDENHEIINEMERSLCHQFSTPHLWVCWGCKENVEKTETQQKRDELATAVTSLFNLINEEEIIFNNEERCEAQDLVNEISIWLEDNPDATKEKYFDMDDKIHILMDPIYQRICDEHHAKIDAESDSDEYEDAKEEMIEFDVNGKMKYPVGIQTFYKFNEWLSHYMVMPSSPLKKFSKDTGEDIVIWCQRVEQWWYEEVEEKQYSQKSTGWIADEKIADFIWKDLNHGNPEEWGQVFR